MTRCSTQETIWDTNEIQVNTTQYFMSGSCRNLVCELMCALLCSHHITSSDPHSAVNIWHQMWVKQENICLTSACTHPSFIHHMVCILFAALKSTSNICCWNNFTDTGVHLPPPTRSQMSGYQSVHRCGENDHVPKPGSDSLLGLLLLFAHCLSNRFGFKSLCLH